MGVRDRVRSMGRGPPGRSAVASYSSCARLGLVLGLGLGAGLRVGVRVRVRVRVRV